MRVEGCARWWRRSPFEGIRSPGFSLAARFQRLERPLEHLDQQEAAVPRDLPDPVVELGADPGGELDSSSGAAKGAPVDTGLQKGGRGVTRLRDSARNRHFAPNQVVSRDIYSCLPRAGASGHRRRWWPAR